MKFKDLSFKDKIEHIWEYYKVHFFVTILGIILVASIISMVYKNATTVIAIDITYIGGSGNITRAQEIKEQVDNYLKEQGIEGEAIFEIFDLTVNDSVYYQANVTKFVGKTTAKDIDILLLDQEVFKQFEDMELFIPIEELIDQNKLLVSKEDILVNERAVDAPGVGSAVNLSDNSRILWKDFTMDERPVYLGLCSNSKRQDVALKVSNWFFNQ